MGAAEFCSESLLRTGSRQVRQEGLGRVIWMGWRLVQNNREILNWTGYGDDNSNHIFGPGLCEQVLYVYHLASSSQVLAAALLFPFGRLGNWRTEELVTHPRAWSWYPNPGQPTSNLASLEW